jgi:hypothetical protein
MEFGLTHCSLEPKQEPVIEACWIVYPVLVENQRISERADFQEPMPVSIVSRQA